MHSVHLAAGEEWGVTPESGESIVGGAEGVVLCIFALYWAESLFLRASFRSPREAALVMNTRRSLESASVSMEVDEVPS